MNSFLQTSIWIAYLLIISVVVLGFGILMAIENRRKEKYLIEINSIQEYENWKKGGKSE